VYSALSILSLSILLIDAVVIFSVVGIEVSVVVVKIKTS